jgi:adenylate cyclase
MTSETGAVRRFELESYNSIGRHPKNTIQIMDRLISKHHARVIYQNNAYYLQDLESRNGTFIDGQRISEVLLEPGTDVRLGTVPLTFSIVESTPQTESLHSGMPTRTTSGPVTIIMDKPLENIGEQLEIHDEFLPESAIQDSEILRKNYEKLRIAHELNRRIAMELNLDKVLSMILEETFKLVQADRGVILLIDENGEFVPELTKLREGQPEDGGNVEVSRAILNKVKEERVGVLSSDAKLDERFSRSESIIMQGIRSAMCVPLLPKADDSKLLGVIVLDTQRLIGVFTEKDLQILSAVAIQAAVAIENARLAKQIEEETARLSHLQRYLSPAVVQRLAKDELTIRMGGEMVDATIMFTDIRGFTSLSENYDPERLVSDLNSYFELLVDVVFAHEGTLDKFIGDAIMAVWGTLDSDPQEDPVRAVRAAFEMQQQLRVFNQLRVEQGLPPFHTGIGVNTGCVTAGNMGSPRRLEFTVIGDDVNLASRLCGKAKGEEVVISHETYLRVKEHFRCTALPLVEVKGKAKALQTYRVEELLTGDHPSRPPTGRRPGHQVFSK